MQQLALSRHALYATSAISVWFESGPILERLDSPGLLLHEEGVVGVIFEQNLYFIQIHDTYNAYKSCPLANGHVEKRLLESQQLLRTGNS